MTQSFTITRRVALGLAAGAVALGLAGPAAALQRRRECRRLLRDLQFREAIQAANLGRDGLRLEGKVLVG